MRFSRRKALVLLGSVAMAPQVAYSGNLGKDAVDWSAFLARHDLIWDRLPQGWDEGPFLGNGLLGAQLYHDATIGALRVDLGRSDVQDHRSPVGSTGYDRARLPIGHFLLRTRGKLTGAVELRLKLHDAILTGQVTTDQGEISLRIYVHAEDMAIVMETNGAGGEYDARWEWVGEEAISPRQAWGLRTNDPKRIDADYRSNPPGILDTDGREQLWLQPLLAGGGTATAWHATPRRLICSVAHSFPSTGARRDALAAVRRAAADPSLERRHIAWWHAYYPASFLSIPDTRIESFYWIQMYKLASATRGDRAYIDNQGPWLQPTAWPYATWNLNVQLNYWAMISSNRAHLAGSLINAIYDNRENLIRNVPSQYRSDSASLGRSAGTNLESPVKPPREDGSVMVDGLTSGTTGIPPETGNLPWALHDIWLVWRHTMDVELLRKKLFPILRRATNYYRHFLKKGSDGKLHLPVTYSPEYAGAPDLNYDLALLRWSCDALIDAAKRLKIDDPLLGEWHRILDQLVDYPCDDTGFLIGRDLPLKSSHRHYSHLLMAYPLYLVNREQPGASELIQRSIDHWQSMPELLRGYSSTGASSLSSALGKGDAALVHLKGLFDDYLRPNTLYKESGPVIETPLSGAQSIHDMLLQSWGGVIRPFPAVPTSWSECVFATMSAEGGFLVSARRTGGKTAWLEIKSNAGEPFVLETDIAMPVAEVNGKRRPMTRTKAGHLTCPLTRGETITIFPQGNRPVINLTPLPATIPNSFGLNPRQSQKAQRDLSL